MKEFIFGTLVYEYELIKQDRKTLSLIVAPDLKIIVKAPLKIENEKIENFLKKKWFWLEKQLSFFKKYQHKFYQKEYVSGESFMYLGRQYKLSVKKSDLDEVLFSKGKLIIYTTKQNDNGKYNKKIIEKWFEERTEKVFTDRLDEMLLKFDYRYTPRLGIREMKKRWGSFLNKNKILLNPKLVHLPKYCIDYVITHELCHFKYKNHDKKFFALLEQKYPKWEKIKDKLEKLGSTID